MLEKLLGIFRKKTWKLFDSLQIPHHPFEGRVFLLQRSDGVIRKFSGSVIAINAMDGGDVPEEVENLCMNEWVRCANEKRKGSGVTISFR